MTNQSVQLLVDAIAFASDKHTTQRRKDAAESPYINHPIALCQVIAIEAGNTDIDVLAAAVLHDTLEDTNTTREELEERFGKEVARIVQEVTDNKSLLKAERKRFQVTHAAHLSGRAKLVKLADKICNIRDVANRPPSDWSLERKREYFDWAKEVVDQIRGTDERLEQLFDAAFEMRP